MRTIEFRGKDIKTGEWRFGDLVHGQGFKEGKVFIMPQMEYYPSDCHDLDGWEVLPETVGEFAGKLDKNGDKIFEGDFLNSPGYGCRVIFENGAFKSVYEHEEDGETLFLEDLGCDKFTILK